MELVLSGFIAGAFFILMIIMFWLGYKEAYRHKVEDPVKIEEFYAGEGWDNDTLFAYKKIVDTIHRELNDEEQKYFMYLVEEGYRGDFLIRKFLEFSRQFKEHH
ncbi:MAG TPA: hypothetical protein DEP48_01000 [Persephonella sp.]|uniref:Uncharacterized protein n=1 Tax=Persephonella marina (strain DSM 14350 / EX-H1) TaxID=123214 RepID=C0QR69_PERMH|nr:MULTISPECIES: hypothetical protein [Persephonella]ACO03346.1 hypothetical protein PERMA_1397 [Persephonella marina EX-H1]HCB68912.1 hypothetical protein [Persephonella sp.]